MKILITNPNNVPNFKPCVTSVIAECHGVEGSHHWLDVLINTTERWMPFHRQAHCPDVANDPSTGRPPVHQFFLIGVDQANETGVLLVAQNAAEQGLLEQLVWEQAAKEQIAIRFMAPGIFVKTVGQWPL